MVKSVSSEKRLRRQLDIAVKTAQDWGWTNSDRKVSISSWVHLEYSTDSEHLNLFCFRNVCYILCHMGWTNSTKGYRAHVKIFLYVLLPVCDIHKGRGKIRKKRGGWERKTLGVVLTRRLGLGTPCLKWGLGGVRGQIRGACHILWSVTVILGDPVDPIYWIGTWRVSPRELKPYPTSASK